MRSYSKPLLVLIAISTLSRGFLAGFLELGNDEVYYWTYALYPDLSHFDHPPMVGWVIQLFTLNLRYDQEFFLRLAPVVLGSLNTLLIYLIGRSISNPLTGWYAAILHTASIYSFLLAGVFILPDTPQLFYWLISLYFILEAFDKRKTPGSRKVQMILAGMSIGLAMLSKYTSVFLWIGTIAYIIIYDRQWLRTAQLYLAILISVVFFLPVVWWNINNDFISFTYQGSRVGFFESGVNPGTFLTELVGQFFYNNPVNVVLLLLAIISLIRFGSSLTGSVVRVIFLTSLPLIFIFLFFSLFRQTLPHWTGPAYTSLILVTASWLSRRSQEKGRAKHLPAPLAAALLVIMAVLVLGAGQIKGGWLFYDSQDDPVKLGRNDVSLDMYGWRQAGEKFGRLAGTGEDGTLNPEGDIIICQRWFPAAHIDYYIAAPLGMKVLGLGPLEQIHKYAWINDARGGFRPGLDAWFITTSRDYKDVYELYADFFSEIEPVDTLRIVRGGRHVENIFIYRMTDLARMPGPGF